ncbi:TMEM175 family protein [Georgenia ruanii]|uniref:DUF1211 domain-containing protein n=1 Tax=Georgenia ruanii TaxID=348442 RepID=A0A7J9UZV4_9MICO|nr:TMEM175 family protein [Georgenia ruanii]MPV89224.1 DUF1211 domain-containing protein [Georgenia ruanii]
MLTRETSEFERGLSFFDAIYAIAITLLVVTIDVPPPEAWQSLATLAASGVPRQLAGFALSFVVIAAFWRVNVRLIQGISAMDPATTRANLVATALVVLVPFTTQAISDPGSASYALPTALYACNIAFAALAQLTMFEVARRHGLERARLSRREHRVWLVAGLVTPAVFLASVPVAFLWGGDVGKLFWLVSAVLSPLAGHAARRRTSR